jgi:hypothetical protein
MSSGVNLSYRANHSRHKGAVPSIVTVGGTIPPIRTREGTGRNVIMTRRTCLHHDGVKGRVARDGA